MNNDYNGYVYNAYKPTPTNDLEMTEERREYLIWKEQEMKRMQRRRQRKKTILNIVLLIIASIIVFCIYKDYFRPVKIDPRINKNSIHYVTDLYYSDGRYYEKYLDDKAKKFYLYWLNDLKKLNKTSTVDCRKFGYSTSSECAEDYHTIFYVILMEHPDLFWYRTSSISSSNGGPITLNHRFVSSNKVRLYFAERRLLRKIDEVASRYKNDTDYDKIKNVYTWLGAEKSYSIFLTRKAGTAWSALLDNSSVCAGFAAASQLLFQRLDIESAVILGSYSDELHAWNFVWLEDGYYWYDSTVGGSADKDASWFYNGLLFDATAEYNPGVIELNEYTFGTKYLNYEKK